MASKKSLNKHMSLQRSNDRSDYNSFKVVLFYCLLIIILPVITFFSVNYGICETLLQLEPVYSNISSAICAVVALHIALGIYIYRAYFGSDEAFSSIETVKKQD